MIKNIAGKSVQLLFLAASALFAHAALAVEVGDKAPDFTLQASDGQSYSLSDYVDSNTPVVIAFFPAAFTGGCTIQCKAIRDSSTEIKNYDVGYFMASVDSPERNAEFAAEYELDFPVLGDPEKTMTEAYGVLSSRGFANRWTYYIDGSGTVVKIDKSTNPNTAGEDLISNMMELGFPRRTQTAAN